MLKLPTHVQLEITDVCNLRCKYCYHFDTDKMPESKDLEDDEMLKLVQKMVDAQIYSLVITGGEPLIRPTIVIKAVEIAKKAGMFVSLNTNLLLLTPKIVIRLKELEINSLLISCPASDPYIYKQVTRCGDYRHLCLKLRLLLDAGVPCMVNMVVTPTNYKFIRSTAVDMARLGVKRFAATPAGLNVECPNYQELLSGEQVVTLLEDLRWCSDKLGLEVDILEPLPKCLLPSWCWEKEYAFTKRVCQAGRMSVSVSNIGDVRPCSHNPVIYGNLFRNSLKEIWNKMSVYREGAVPIDCKCCPIVLSCNGACRTNSLAATGVLNTPDRLMVGHIGLIDKKQTEIVIDDNSLLCFKGNLRWRREDENYSISSKISGGNLIVVNQEMFHFVRWLAEALPLSIKELAKNGAEGLEREAFVKIIRLLVKKEFIYFS